MHNFFSLDDKTITVLKQSAREISSTSLRHLGRIDKVEIADLAEHPVVFAHWMSLILAGGKDIRVTFKTFFMTNDAVKIISSTNGFAKVPVSQSLDFIKEFCNLVLGGLKSFFAENEIKVGASLPIVTRGFDEVFFPPPVGEINIVDHWKLKTTNATIICSVVYEIFDAVKVHKAVVLPSDGAIGEVEYL